MSVTIREYIISGNHLIQEAPKNEKSAISWTELIEELKRDTTPIDILFIYDNCIKDCDNPDILAHTLDFAMFVGFMCRCSSFNQIGRVQLRLINEPTEKREFYRLHSSIVNFFKCLSDESTGRLEVYIGNSRNIFNSKKYISQTPRNFLPAFPLDEDLYQFLFKTTLIDSLKKMNAGFETLSFYEKNNQGEVISVCFKKLIICFIRERLFDGLKKGSVISSEVIKWIMDRDSSLTVFEALLSSIYFKKYRKFLITGKKIEKDDVGYILSECSKYIESMMLGIREICENVLKHTDEGLGLLYFRIQEDRTTHVLKLDNSYKEDSVDWFEISVLDFNSEGILDTYRRDNYNIENVSFEDIYNVPFDWNDVRNRLQKIESRYGKDTENDEDDIRHLLFGIGLRVFRSLILQRDGYFSVSTVEKKEHQLDFICHARKEESSKKKQTNTAGTKYSVLIPIKKFAKMQDIVSGVRYGATGLNYYQEVPRVLTSNIFTLFWREEEARELEIANVKDSSKIITFLIERGMQCYNRLSSDIVIIDFSAFSKITTPHIDKLLFYYFLSVFFGEHKCKYFLFVGLKRQVIESFESSYIELMYSYGKVDNPIHNESWLFLFDESGDPYVFNGLDKMINEDYNAHYRRLRLREYNSERTGEIAKEKIQVLLFPFEVLPGDGLNSFVFHAHVKKMLSRSFGDKFGIKHEKHIKLGSKIHADQFYQAELLFTNSYYTDCFAIVIAKDLLQNWNGSGICIVGYKNYSKMLIEKIRRLVETKERSVKSIVYHDDHEQFYEEFERLNAGECKNYVYVNIVPISSSLKTFNKMYSDIIRAVRRKCDDFSYVFPKNPINYCIVEIRDASSLNEESGLASLEKDFGWQSVQKNKITIKHDYPFLGDDKLEAQEIRYFIAEYAKWHSAIGCPVCDTNGKVLLSTHNSSLMLKDNMGLPHVVSRKSYMGEEGRENDYRKLLDELCDFMAYGHMTRFGSEFLYYFNSGDFFHKILETNILLENLKEWAIKLKNDMKLPSNNYVNILLVPDHFSNDAFAEWILDNVFDRIGFLIREDFGSVFYSNFREKYRFIRELPDVRLFFIDDAVVSGSSFLRCLTLAKELVGSEKPEVSIIALATRLDYQNYELIKNLCKCHHTFFEIYAPAFHENRDTCWLCEEQEVLKQISNHTFDLKFKEFVKENSENYLNRLDLNKGHRKANVYFERAKKNHIKQRFLLTNEIFYKISKLVNGKCPSTNNEIDTDKLCDILGLSNEANSFSRNIMDESQPVSISYKMNMIRILSMVPLREFMLIREIAHKLTIEEIKSLLAKSNENTPEYLIFLIESLSTFNVPYIIDLEVIVKVYDYLKSNTILLYRYRCAIQRLCSNDQNIEYLLMKRALLLIESEEMNGFKSFLERVILENNCIIENAKNYYALDKKYTQGGDIETDVMLNYYYDIFRETWKLFQEEYNISSQKTVLEQIYFPEEYEAHNNSPLANGTNRPLIASFSSRVMVILEQQSGDDNIDKIFTPHSIIKDNKNGDYSCTPWDRDESKVKINNLENFFYEYNGKYIANFYVNPEVIPDCHCTFVLHEDYKRSLFLFKLLCFLKDSMNTEVWKRHESVHKIVPSGLIADDINKKEGEKKANE